METLELNASHFDCGDSFYIHELELLDAIAAGQTSFNRGDCPNLDDIDAHLRSFADVGYVPKVVRAVYPPENGKLVRIDVVGGLTGKSDAANCKVTVEGGVTLGTPVAQQVSAREKPRRLNRARSLFCLSSPPTKSSIIASIEPAVVLP